MNNNGTDQVAVRIIFQFTCPTINLGDPTTQESGGKL
jgi:hypothetical protein